MLAQLGAERPFQQALLQLLEQPFLTEQILRRAVACNSSSMSSSLIA